MTVYVVACSDTCEGGDVWVHGVYATKAQAVRVFTRLTENSYYTVKIDKRRVRDAANGKDR